MLKNKTVVITGASAGIGAALAREAAAQGATAVLLARRKDRLDGLVAEITGRGGKAIGLLCDVTLAADVERVAAAIRAQVQTVDVVVANAGFGVVGNVLSLKVEDYRRQFETNVFGVLHTIYAFADDLQKSKGNLVLLSSVMGYVSLPGGSPYAMSKHAVQALGESIRSEWKARGVSVTTVCPGFVQSEIRRVNNRGQLQERESTQIPAWLEMPAETAARKILRAAVCRRAELPLTLHARGAMWLRRFFPCVMRFLFDHLKISGRSEA